MKIRPTYEYRYSGVLDDGTRVGVVIIHQSRYYALMEAVSIISQEQCKNGNEIKEIKLENVSLKDHSYVY